MATERPLKEGSVRTYQEKVALGFPDILASEVDADLDTIYAAWNGGPPTGSITSLMLADGAVTQPKLAPGVTALPSGAAGGDLAGSTYPNPVVAAGKITKAKLGPDVSGRVIATANVPGVGQGTTVLTSLVDWTAETTLPSRMYRLTFGGRYQVAAGSGGSIQVDVGGQSYFVAVFAVGASTYRCALDFLIDSGAGWASGHIAVATAFSGNQTANASAVQSNAFSRVSGTSSLGPKIWAKFSTASPDNFFSLYTGVLEIF